MDFADIVDWAGHQCCLRDGTRGLPHSSVLNALAKSADFRLSRGRLVCPKPLIRVGLWSCRSVRETDRLQSVRFSMQSIVRGHHIYQRDFGTLLAGRHGQPYFLVSSLCHFREKAQVPSPRLASSRRTPTGSDANFDPRHVTVIFPPQTTLFPIPQSC